MKDISARLVDALYAGTLAPAGCRVNHARGLLVEGRFRAHEAAPRLSLATVFDGAEHAVIARFSSSSGDPDVAQDDPKGVPCGLALEIGGEGGMTLVGHSTAGFPAGKPEQFLTFIEAQNAKAADKERGRREATERPAPHRTDPLPAAQPSSFAALSYHMLHTYVLTEAAGGKVAGRLVVSPVAGGGTTFVGANLLDDEFSHRLLAGPVEMTLGFVAARSTDPTSDISARWPGDRPPIVLGRLLLDRTAADQGRQRRLAFDPSRLPLGVAFAGDPMVEARIRAYRLAADRRAGSSC